jgi:carboxymethylenebutenolidase
VFVEVFLFTNFDPRIYWYDAGHGFNCDARGSYNKEAAHLARKRSLSFLKEHLG